MLIVNVLNVRVQSILAFIEFCFLDHPPFLSFTILHASGFVIGSHMTLLLMQTSILNHVDIFNTYIYKQRWMMNMSLHNYSVLLYPIQIQLCPISSHYHCITILSHALGVKPSQFTSHCTMIYPMQTKCSPTFTIKTPSKLVIHHPSDLKPKEDGYNPCSLISNFPIQFFPHPFK